MAYPCTSRHISERGDGTFAVVSTLHTIDRHGERQDDSDEVVYTSRDAAWAAAGRGEVFS